MIIAVVVAGVAAYYPVAGFDFTYDDNPQILVNPAITGWRFFPGYFLHDVWYHSAVMSHGSDYYRPAFLVWLRLNYLIFGLAPPGWHLATLAVHLVCSILVFLLADRLTGSAVAAWVAALVFTLHPVHAEAVAWVSGGTEPLYSVFLLAAFLCYSSPSKRRRIVGPILYLFALFNKETAIVLPGLIVAHAWLFASPACRQKARSVAVIVAPYLAVTGCYFLLRIYALRGMVTAASNRWLGWALVPQAILFYIKQSFWPIYLRFIYDPLPQWSVIEVTAATLGIVLAVFMFGRISRESPVLGFSGLWFALPLLPLLKLSERYVNPGHDRYLYLPSIGLCVLAGLAVSHALRSARVGSVRLVSTSMVVFATGTVVFAAGTQVRKEIWPWVDNRALYGRALKFSPENLEAIHKLAVEVSRTRPDESISLFQEVLAKVPDDREANVLLGVSLYRVHRIEEAEAFLRRASRINPADPTPYMFIALIRLDNNQIEEAEQFARSAISALRTERGEPHIVLGRVLKRKGDLEGAESEFRKALSLNPNDMTAHLEWLDLRK
jgi:hypothetical protein